MGVRKRAVEIGAGDGPMPAVLIEPEGDGPFPAVVVIMEAFGLLPHIEQVAARLAGVGYVALAPDFYYRELPDNRVSYDQIDRAIALMQKLDDGKFTEDMRAALAFLRSRPNVNGEKLGVTGFCMGGRLAFLTACALPNEIAAAAPFYGGGIAGHLELADRIQVPLLLFFGEQDPFIPMVEVREIDERLRVLGVDYRLRAYPGADHGFFCDERASYHAEAAVDAWNQLERFFSEKLGDAA
ncbi:MAG: dienelactone hydrolase family protein [Myxococcales bacterium]|nr:dienelactone hydrolase family protein [Myxococcales bacterium]